MRMFMAITLFSVVGLFTTIITGCDTAPKTSDKDIQHVDYQMVKEWIGESTDKKPLLLVDLRSAAQFEAGHLPGAVHIPIGNLDANDSRFVKADKIVVYHESFTGLYADLAAKKLIAGGVSKVHSYGGGYMDWTKREARE